MNHIVKHIVTRGSILFLLMLTSVPVGLSTLPSNRRCGTGDILSVIAWFVLFYVLWTLGLLIELFFLNKKQQLVKRNSNLIMALTLPLFLAFLYISLF